MATPTPSDRIRTAITAAAEKLSRSANFLTGDRTLPSPGDLYVFNLGEEVGIEWLVVRTHPDNPDLILLAPIDDFPFAAPPDLVLPIDRVGRPMTVRCGETDWFPKSLFHKRFRVGVISEDVLALVKGHLADLARGHLAGAQDPEANGDPEYEDWMAEVAQARASLLARAALMLVTPPPLPATEPLPEFALAAEPGGHFWESLPRPVVKELMAVADEPLWRTNPVWCIELLRKRQPEIADLLQRALPRTNSGVVGLVVDVITQHSLIVPLIVERSLEWQVDPTLPFRQQDTLPELLGRLLRSLGLPNRKDVPERFAFTLRDPLSRRSDGPSMHLAGLLAIIRHANDNPPLFDRSCCVAQPNGDRLPSNGDRLVSIGNMENKLEAFRREYGTGTLLVRCRDALAAAFDKYFDTVWEVDSFDELAQKLESEGLLQVFLDGQPLSRRDAQTVLSRIRHLERTEHRYTEALTLAQRAQRVGFHVEVPRQMQREFGQCIIDLYRHLGAYKKAAQLAREEYSRSRSSAIQSYEDQALADLNYAAALYDPHCFAAIHDLLNPWLERLSDDPRLITPLTRIKLFNTLGRAWVASERTGWEGLFQRSEQILQEVEPTDLPRTWCYLAHGYLRSERLPEAKHVLDRIEKHPGLDEMSRRFFCFFQADLARRQGRIWSDPAMEEATTMPRSDAVPQRTGRTTSVGHPLAFYLQATARQPGRSSEDALDRFRRAREFLTQDMPDDDPENILQFLVDCLSLAEAGWKGDSTQWRQMIAAIESHLARSASESDGFASYYAEKVPAKESAPSQAAAERLLNRVPFF